VAVYEDEFGSVAEDDLVGGGAEVELLLGRLRVVEPVLEGGGAFGGELAGACGGEASSGDGVAVVDLGRDVVVDAGLDFGRRLNLNRGGHFWSPCVRVRASPAMRASCSSVAV